MHPTHTILQPVGKLIIVFAILGKEAKGENGFCGMKFIGEIRMCEVNV
jgi:hypothetical protein